MIKNVQSHLKEIQINDIQTGPTAADHAPLSSEELTALAVDALDDLKATNIVILDVRKLTDVTDHMVIASGRSSRQVTALAENVVLKAKRAGHRPLGVEGLRAGEWVLVDLNDVVVHVMLPEQREHYQLEKLWGEYGAPLRATGDDPAPRTDSPSATVDPLSQRGA